MGLSGIEHEQIRLEENSLLNAAMAQTSLRDFGDNKFRDGLRVLLESLNGEARLTDFGRTIAIERISYILRERLKVTEDIKQNPEILGVKIEKPLIIIGLPRTGSTILHKLIASDPDNRFLSTWECNLLSPPPTAETYADDARIEEWTRFMSKLFGGASGIEVMHPVGARLPEECMGLKAYDFQSQLFNYQYDVRSYNLWLEEQDLMPVYETHRMLLQYLQWKHQRKRWILKSVCHVWGLEEILKVYPDAQIIQTHRDPVKVIASLCSLMRVTLAVCSDRFDEKGIAQHWARSWERGLHKLMDFRESGRVERSQIIDVKYEKFMEDTVGMVKSIYGYFNIDLRTQSARCIEEFMSANPRDKHGTHTYSLEEFGLDAGEVADRYRFYKARFEL